MSNAITQVRTTLRDALKDAGFHAFTTPPERATPPMVFVGPGSPYVTHTGAAFGGRIVRCTLVMVAARGTNEKNAEDLDQMILDVTAAVDNIGYFQIDDVGLPGQLSLNGQSHLAVGIDVQTEVHP